jgi:SIR2-like domain
MSEPPAGEVRLPRKYRANIETLASALTNGECLIFLGAGASVDRSRADLPTGSELSHKLAKKCELEPPESVPLSTAAFYYEALYKRIGLNEFLRREIDNAKIEPSETIHAVVELALMLEKIGKQIFVVTTNYDRHFETSYKRQTNGAEPKVIIYRGAEDSNDLVVDLHTGLDGVEPDYWAMREPRTHLYKMHGCISRLDGQGLVITEEDYVNFMTNALSNHPNKRLLYAVRGKIALNTILFIGYSLSDWNFRVIFKATAERATKRPSYAIQYFDLNKESEQQRMDATVEFWAKKNVTILNHDASSFMRALIAEVAAQLAPAVAQA